MKINIFEGGRRIHTVIAWGGIVGLFLLSGIFLEPKFAFSAQELKMLLIASTVWSAIVHVLSFAIGWIARGFLGVPFGKDHADEQTTSNKNNQQ